MWLLIFVAHFVLVCDFISASQDIQIEYRNEIDQWLRNVNRDLLQFNAISAKLTWDATIGGANADFHRQADQVVSVRNNWKNRVCDSKIETGMLTSDQSRMIYLLCRGPKFTEITAKMELAVLNKMRRSAEVEVCFPEDAPTALEKLTLPGQEAKDYPKPGECLLGEPDLEMLMKRTDLNVDQLKWVWKAWHDPVASAMRNIYPNVVKTQNLVARANGYADMGHVWRDEIEMPNLQIEVFELYKQIEPLYQMLHAVVRHKLLKKYGSLEVDATGPIPIHLLGNMWGQNWAPLINLFVPSNKSIDLERSLKEKNWTARDMVLQAEDFYTSLGLPHMTEKFWKYSIFEEAENTTMCHGTAANMFRDDDYRMLMCTKINMEDFYVIHHEMGHIEYNMAYKNQPAIYQEGTNSAFHETIGDVIMHGVMAPQHLHRLGLMTDRELLSDDAGNFLLLQQALAKVAEIPFALIVDEYRWNIFNGKIKDEEYNTVYWKLNERLRGVSPPEKRGETYFDAGAKFHVPDNTPYIRYFLSSILQMQVFKGLCEMSLFGKFKKANNFSDETLKIPLHKCDIYGCKKCGRILQKAMALGASAHWTKVLEILTGKNYITTKPLLEYYEPTYEWLKKYAELNNLPLGW